MKLIRLALCIFFLCTFLVVAARPVQAAVLYLATQTVTPLTATPSPSPTGPTSTSQKTNTPASSPTQTATTTLIPLPAITLIFPASTPTPEDTITTTPVPITEAPEQQDHSGLGNLSQRFKLLGVLIVILWLILIGFAILYIRQFR